VTTPPPGMGPEERAAYRAFVREHHPDRGGDPDAFVAGLARFRAGSAAPPERPDTADRYDAPVEIVTPLPLPTRVAVALIRTLRRHRARRVE
jgi:hypothetical protein